ncbi:MAG: hypothetical protein AB4352_20990 [Hormoscilla sp.]
MNGTHFYRDVIDWEAWIPQTSGDNVAVLNLITNEVDYIEVGNLTISSRRGEIDSSYFFTHSDEGAIRIDLTSHEVSDAVPVKGQVSRMAVVEFESEFRVFIGTEGHDVLLGTRNVDLLSGGGGSDSMVGGPKADTLIGGAGRDFLHGDDGADTLIGGAGQDKLYGQGGNDLFVLEVGKGRDTIRNYQIGEDRLGLSESLTIEQLGVSVERGDTLIKLLESNQILAILDNVTASLDELTFVPFVDFEHEFGEFISTEGPNMLLGTRDRDLLFGSDDRDRIAGGQNADTLIGGAGRDILYGENGADILIGGAGQDKLYGQRGNDLFVLEVGKGRDTIRDYQIGEDRLGLSEGLTIEQLGVSVEGGDTLIKLLDTNQILAILDNVVTSLDELTFVPFTAGVLL